MAKQVKSEKSKVKSLGGNDLQKEAKELRKELAGLRLEHAQFKLKNTSFITTTRKKLARVLTQMNMRKEQANG